jgi:DNA mismatch repair protein MSH4
MIFRVLTDNHSYSQTISTLHVLVPDEILLHDGCKTRVLTQKIIDSFVASDCRVFFISRQYFDQDRGAEMLSKISLPHSVDSDLIRRYTVLAGVYCLCRYIENIHNFLFGENTLRIKHANSCNNMLIDGQTALDLELICNARSGNQKESLFGVVNNTKTVAGERLLRTNILRPCFDVVTVDSRLDFVEFMLENLGQLSELGEIFSDFPDLERMLSGLTVSPQNQSTKTAKAGIDTLIFLKSALHILSSRIVPILTTLVTQSRHLNPEPAAPVSLIDSFIANFDDTRFETLSNRLSEILTESTFYSSSTDVMRHQECFALKAESTPVALENNTSSISREAEGDPTGESRSTNESTSRLQILLSIARTSFLQCVEDIHMQAEVYSQQLAGMFPGSTLEGQEPPLKDYVVKVKYSSLRGYHLIVPSSALKGQGRRIDALPDIFIQPIELTNSIACTTVEVSSLSDRARESIESALSLTHSLIKGTVEEIRVHFLKDLHAFVDSVSLMDMLMGFACLVRDSAGVYSRPEVLQAHNSTINDGDVLILENSRHPILSELSGGQGQTQAFVENSVLMDGSFSQLQIITGVNGSGKSTLIRQVALITILAQIGCFVPCASATVPLRDRLLSRLSNQDDMENNMSTFHLEMKAIAYILDNMTDQSLVIIDELGRGSSNIDGLSIAFAVAERLALCTSAFTLFATHFTQITKLSRMYPNIQNIHLKTELQVQESGEVIGSDSSSEVISKRIIHHYSLYLGPYEVDCGYGILVSESMSFDKLLVSDAKSFLALLMQAYPSLLGRHVVVDERAVTRIFINHLIKHFRALQRQTCTSSTYGRHYFHRLMGTLTANQICKIKSTLSL